MSPDLTIPRLNEAAQVAWLKYCREADMTGHQAAELHSHFILAFKLGSLFGHELATETALKTLREVKP